MKAARLLLLLYAGFLLRSLSLFLWGNGGLSDYRKVEAGRVQLAANIEELKLINSGLRREAESLGSDPERVALEARRLGYFREGQRVVRFQGRTPPPGSYTLGALVRVQAPRERRDWPWKLAGLLLPLAAYAAWALARRPPAYGGSRAEGPPKRQGQYGSSRAEGPPERQGQYGSSRAEGPQQGQGQ